MKELQSFCNIRARAGTGLSGSLMLTCHLPLEMLIKRLETFEHSSCFWQKQKERANRTCPTPKKYQERFNSVKYLLSCSFLAEWRCSASGELDLRDRICQGGKASLIAITERYHNTCQTQFLITD